MFAALTLVRLREAAAAATPSLLKTASWQSSDDVAATDLPLARSTEKTLASMHAVLIKTAETRDIELKGAVEEDEKKMHLMQTKASEVRIVRFVDDLRKPYLEGVGVKFKAETVEMQEDAGTEDTKDDSDVVEMTEKTGSAKLSEDKETKGTKDEIAGDDAGKVADEDAKADSGKSEGNDDGAISKS